MDGLQFQAAVSSERSDPARADIACFVGFAAPRTRGATLRARLETALRGLGWSGPPLPAGARVVPEHVVPYGDERRAFHRWLVAPALSWTPSPNAVADSELFRRAAAELLGGALVEWWIENAWLAPSSGRTAADLLELADVPVPIDTWDAFDQLFAWEQRPLLPGRQADTTLGAAVRRFFLQGGRKCYVVRAGEPWPVFAGLGERVAARERVLNTVVEPSPVDRLGWRGIGHLFGLPDASFLCVPDLPDLFAVEVPPIDPETEPEGPERFIECGTRVDPETSRSLRAFPAPRCDEAAFRGWAALVKRVGVLLRRFCPEVQFVAAVPLPVAAAPPGPEADVAVTTARERRAARDARVYAARVAQREQVRQIQTAFVQLTYPWLQTRESQRLAGAIEAPDAMLTGLLANNALTNGTWRSLDREPVPGLIALDPMLSIEEMREPLPYAEDAGVRRLPRTFRDRISLFGPTSRGFQLLSDVTTDDDEAYRPANVNRLVASILRAARRAGESAVFMNNGEAVWRQLRSSLESLLLQLWADGALGGASSAEAFEVRCDRSTMTQADLDAGRAIARVQFTAASPIENIVVVLAMDEAGHVTLVASETEGALEASA